MARLIQATQHPTVFHTPISFLRGLALFCIYFRRKLFITLLAMVLGSTIGLAVFSWAYGSYKVLTDDPRVWQSSIDRLAAEDNHINLTNRDTLFVGSSSIRMFKDLEQTFPEYGILKKGFGGAKINDLAHYSDSLIFNYQPKLIVLYIGINDILYRQYQDTNELSQDLFKLTGQIQQRLPTTDLVLLAVRPLEGPDYSRAVNLYNEQLERYASRHQSVHYVNANSVLITENKIPNADLIMWDGLHLNAAGYHAWGHSIRNKLKHLDLL